MLYSVVVLLPTTYENGKHSGKHLSTLVSIFGVNGEFIQEQAFMVINHDAFATGFVERIESCEGDSCDGGPCV